VENDNIRLHVLQLSRVCWTVFTDNTTLSDADRELVTRRLADIPRSVAVRPGPHSRRSLAYIVGSDDNTETRTAGSSRLTETSPAPPLAVRTLRSFDRPPYDETQEKIATASAADTAVHATASNIDRSVCSAPSSSDSCREYLHDHQSPPSTSPVLFLRTAMMSLSSKGVGLRLLKDGSVAELLDGVTICSSGHGCTSDATVISYSLES